MLPIAPDVLALDDQIIACERCCSKLLAALSTLSQYHIVERFPGLSEYIASQAENAKKKELSLLSDAVYRSTNTRQVASSISQELAAQFLGISTKTLSRLEHNPQKMHEMGYPGRNIDIKIFKDWADPIRTTRMLNKAARDRTRARQS